MAGYAQPNRRGYDLSRRQIIKEAIFSGIKEQAADCGPPAISVLRDLLSSDNERIKLAAAIDLADRAGLKPKAQAEIEIKDDRTDSEIEASIKAALEELEINGGNDRTH